ncbi:carbohydrate ABC transporter permease [Allostreptomyces psammosilenae]|uniref:Multiple sugar transport system permease protein n=1 Tax=Allostreptomyces psammosilenae TaxID=1892865 RepID=A0A853A0J7_9ACTN|nr:sugar ABC transporter permease [Allostreptomyces psammosilenae]NYI03918.1 multiple sugar transport system permease protein [Allostreptomyces psammosilenae]
MSGGTRSPAATPRRHPRPRPHVRPPGRPGRRRPGAARRALAALAFLLPTLLVFGYFAWWPILRSVTLSFQHTNLIDPPSWVGWANFGYVLTDPLLATTVRNTVWFVLLALVLGFPLPLFLAVVMSELRRFGALFRVLVYLPVVVPPVVAVLLWRWFYDPDYGLFNQALGLVGLGPYPWLQSTATAMPSLVLQATWAAAGSSVLIYLAALVSVPTELYEAAEIDGASIRRRLWHVTLPHLRGVLLVMLLLQIIGTFRVFTEPFVLTDGGPEDSTTTILLLIYRYAFVYGDYGAAAALGVLLAIALAALSAVYLRATRRWNPS